MVTLGVEEELFLVDAETGALVDAAERLLPGGDTEHLKRELFACIVETTTPVTTEVEQVRAALVAGRARLGAECERHGLRPLACGAHPLARPRLPRVVDTPRYQRIARMLGPLLGEQVICGLHVHLGFGTREQARNALEGVIPWLPAILALSANSPYDDGVETPLVSVRAERLGRIAATALPPAPGHGQDEPGQDETDWWDVRVNRRHGTLELRVPDQPTSVERAAAIVALAQALGVAVARRTNSPADRAAYARARAEALRGRQRVSVTELARFVERDAVALGTWTLVAGLLESETEAERQLRVGRRAGLEALVRELADRTLA